MLKLIGMLLACFGAIMAAGGLYAPDLTPLTRVQAEAIALALMVIALPLILTRD